MPRPVYSHGLVFVCTGYEGPAALLAIRPEGQGDVTDTHIAWQVNKFVPYNPSMLAVDDVLYAVSDNGIATAREIESGRLIWRHRLGGNYSASPIFADGKIYMLSEEGICTVIEPGNEYRELATNDFGERTFASFAVTDSAIIARTENHLYRIEALSRGAD